MKNLYIITMFAIDLMYFVDSAVKDYKFFPNLPSVSKLSHTILSKYDHFLVYYYYLYGIP